MSTTPGRNSPARPSIRETIAARRAELRITPKGQRHGDLQTYGSPLAKRAGTPRGFVALDGAGGDLIDDKTVEGQVKKAVKSGKLDISSLSLDRIPAEVYTKLLGIPTSELSNPPPPPPPVLHAPRPSRPARPSTSPFAVDDDDERTDEGRELVFGKSTKQEEAWTEPEELTSFKAGDNKIESVEVELGMFGGLRILDLSNNLLKTVPNKLSDLLRLTTVDLSHNSLTAVPPSLLLLPALQVLDLSHNSLTTVSFASPVGPTEDGLAYGSGFFTTSFQRAAALKATRPTLPVLRHLNLGHNRLTIKGLEELKTVPLKGMRVLNVESNDLQGVLDLDGLGIGEEGMPELAQLVLSGNTNLRGTSGSLGKEAKVEALGCNLREATPARTRESTPGVATTGDDEVPAAEPEEPASPVPNPDHTFVYRTLPAATFDSMPLAVDFDIYLPSAAAGPSGHPLVIWFHGGGLLQGNKENLPPHFRRLPSHPFPKGESQEHVAVISPNYRLAPQVPIIDILSDVTALLTYVRTKLNDRLVKEGKGDHKVDASRICLSGGSAGGYLALIAGLGVPKFTSDEDLGGYRGLAGAAGGAEGIKCLAPFYPITDLTDEFWATKTDPVPWMGGKSISHADAKPHIDTKAPPVATAISGGPRSVLYPYMLQHALFPSLLFLTQRSVGSGLDAFRPSPLSLSIPHRLELTAKSGRVQPHVPIYYVYGTIDDKVQPMEKTLEALGKVEGELVVERVEGGDHAYDEDPRVECEAFREWLGKKLL
ncbi:hypothetical protein IAT38_007501 [Cryptococcus sp. DSM 104549]